MKKVLLGLLIVLSVLICCVSCVFFEPKEKGNCTVYEKDGYYIILSDEGLMYGTIMDVGVTYYVEVKNNGGVYSTNSWNTYTIGTNKITHHYDNQHEVVDTDYIRLNRGTIVMNEYKMTLTLNNSTEPLFENISKYDL